MVMVLWGTLNSCGLGTLLMAYMLIKKMKSTMIGEQTRWNTNRSK